MLDGDPVVKRLEGEISYLKDAVIPALRDEVERMRAAWLYHTQLENECAADGKPCQIAKCGCDLEVQNMIDGGVQQTTQEK